MATLYRLEEHEGDVVRPVGHPSPDRAEVIEAFSRVLEYVERTRPGQYDAGTRLVVAECRRSES